jgi:hypothetical protein
MNSSAIPNAISRIANQGAMLSSIIHIFVLITPLDDDRYAPIGHSHSLDGMIMTGNITYPPGGNRHGSLP